MMVLFTAGCSEVIRYFEELPTREVLLVPVIPIGPIHLEPTTPQIIIPM